MSVSTKQLNSLNEKITEIANDAQIPYGLHIVKPDKNQLQLRLDEGYRFLAYSVDSVFLSEAAKAPSTSRGS